jgi:predicted component of type VI protein secretion system
MNVRLTLRRDRKCVWSAQIKHTEATLGRARGCTVRIPSSEVSRQHCRLRMEKGMLTVEDLESVNGTFVNGRRIRGIQSVHPGDRLTLGSVTFFVEYAAATEAYEIPQDDDVPMVEAVHEAEIVEETPAHPKRTKVEQAEPIKEAEPIAEVEDASEVLSILDDPGSEVHLPESGDDFRDFLIELDDSSERPNLR